MIRIRLIACAMAALAFCAPVQAQSPGTGTAGTPETARETPTFSRPSPYTVPEPAAEAEKPSVVSSLLKTGEGMAEGIKALPTRQVMRAAARDAARALPQGQQASNAAEQIFRRSSETAQGLKSLAPAAEYIQGLDTLSDIAQVGDKLANEGGAAAGAEAVDVVLNNSAGSYGAAGGASGGAWLGGATCGPAGAVVGTVVGAVVGAVCSSAAYQRYVGPHVKKAVKEFLENQPPPNAPTRETWKSLAIEGPGEVEPGATTQFRAFATLVVEFQAPQFGPGQEDVTRLVSRELQHVDVTQRVRWAASAGEIVGAGGLYADCNQEGASMSVFATAAQLEASAPVTVKQLPLKAIEVTVQPAQAYPGATVALAAMGTYGNGQCERRAPLTEQVTWQASEGGSVSAGSLQISPDKTSGSVSVSATGPGKVASNTAVVAILQPKLEQIEVTARSTANPCEVVEFAAYGYYSNQPQLRQPLRGANWTFSGRYAQLGPSSVRAIWPNSSITATVTADQLTQQASVQVLPLPKTSPYFPIEDVTIATGVKVGASIQNRATEFYCQGDRPSSRTATAGIAWSSDSAGVLSCTATGACTGLKPGIANVILKYENREVTRRPVTVFAEPAAAAATPDGTSTTPAQPQRKLISLTIAPASSTIRSGQTVYFSVIATFDDGTVEDVTGAASISHGNPFARKEAGTYPISAMYQGVIGRGATVQVMKDEAATPQPGVAAGCATASDCPADHDCVQNRCVRSGAGPDEEERRAMELQSSRTQRRAGEVGGKPIQIPGLLGSGGRFTLEGLRQQMEGAAGGTPSSGPASTGPAAGTTAGGSTVPGTPGTSGPSQPAGPAAAATLGWYVYAWHIEMQITSCSRWLFTNFNVPQMAAKDIPEYEQYVLKSLPGIAQGKYLSGRVERISGPHATRPATPPQRNTCLAK